MSGILLTDAFGPVVGSAVFFNSLPRELIAIMLISGLVHRNRSWHGRHNVNKFTLPVLRRAEGLEIIPADVVHGFILSLLVLPLIAFLST
ncbi:LysO family transporter [Yokenella regensburgei]|nr:LysO family transporter [Yokenella regensburgei]